MSKPASKVRIGLVLDCDVMGGTRTYAELLITMLCEQGYNLVALIPDHLKNDSGFLYFLQTHGVTWKTYPPVRGLLMDRQPLVSLWEWRHLISFVCRCQPDMLFISNGTPGSWLSAFFLPLPIIHMLHTSVQPQARLERLVTPWLLKTLGGCRRLCTVSSFASEQIKTLWRARATVVHNPTRFPTAAMTPPLVHAIKRVITMGHVVEYKNPHVWVSVAQRVLAKYPDVQFVWYGAGPLLYSMRNLTKGIDGICFAGMTRDPAPCYAGATMYFQPSVIENHALSVLEAMSFGLPCVASDVGGMPESIAHGVTGFIFSPDDGLGMTEALCHLLESPEHCYTMGVAGQARVREAFMPKDWQIQTVALINSVLLSQ